MQLCSVTGNADIPVSAPVVPLQLLQKEQHDKSLCRYSSGQSSEEQVVSTRWTHSLSPDEKCTRTDRARPVLLEDDHAVRAGTATFVLAVVGRFGSRLLASGGTLRTRSKIFKSEVKQAEPEEHLLIAVSRADENRLKGRKDASDHERDACLNLVKDLVF